MPDLAMLDYFYGDEAEQFTFYRIPKVLFTDPSYRRISSDAKILYGLMLDRMGLSVRNGWLDEYNRVFIFFTLEDALEYLCCGHTKAVSLFLLIALAAPFMLFGLYEKNGQPLEKILKNIIRVRLLAPAARPYQTNNRFAALERQARYEKEVQQLVSIQNKATGKNSRGLGTSRDPARHQADRRRQKACGKGNPAGKKRG